MKITALTKVTLVLNRNMMAVGVFTARNTIRQLITGGAMALDINYERYDWEDYQDYAPLLDDQPILCSAHSEWKVPTVIFLKNYGNMPTIRKKALTRRQLFSMYGGVCQYCLKKIDFKDCTKDHVYPKARGGTNDDFNFVLACKACNSHKSDTYPFRDKNNKEVKPKTVTQLIMTFNHLGVKHRAEWDPFMFKKK